LTADENNLRKQLFDVNYESYSEIDLDDIMPIFVSRMSNHKVTGAAHQETIRSAQKMGQGKVISKVSLAKLKLENGEIKGYYNPDSDVLLYNALKERLEQLRQQQQNSGNNDTGHSTDNTSSSDRGYSNPASSGFAWPVPGHYYVISSFAEDRGYSHKGVDITGGGIMGATCVAALGGTVVTSNNTCSHNWGKSGSCGCGGGYGNYVLIDHGNGKTTLYAHLSSATVSTGSQVGKGQTIGYIGSTGWSTGAHLHYECRYNGAIYDPMSEY
jgi:murein DD-endopeptidase MepM/ murein hydrolase activator NlpD